MYECLKSKYNKSIFHKLCLISIKVRIQLSLLIIVLTLILQYSRLE